MGNFGVFKDVIEYTLFCFFLRNISSNVNEVPGENIEEGLRTLGKFAQDFKIVNLFHVVILEETFP